MVFEIYVPFITEDLNRALPDQYAPLTYRYGKPTIKWTIDSKTVLPKWVSTFQWMRTKNSIYSRYLQWVINQVTYLSATRTTETPEIETTPNNYDAVAIKISLKNIFQYSATNNDSLVGYQFQDGDRLRIISDRDLSPINGINDFEVTGYDISSVSIIIKSVGTTFEIKSGMFIEIFNPKSVETLDEQIFYEVGETIPVSNGILSTFSGTFKNGDTYWRGRQIVVSDDATNFASAYPVSVEDASISDFFKSLESM